MGECAEYVLRDLMKLIADGDLVRNIDNDGDFMKFTEQGIRIVSVMKRAQIILDYESNPQPQNGADE